MLPVLACSPSARARQPPPPAAPLAAACVGDGIEQVDGVFAMTYGDPPAAGQRPRVSFTLALPDGATIVLLIVDELLASHDAGRALQGRRVAAAGKAVNAGPRTLRVCAITPH
jgi:hypothetical protein